MARYQFRISGLVFHEPVLPNIPYIGVVEWRNADNPDVVTDPTPCALNEDGKPICPNGKPLDRWDEDKEENDRLCRQMEAYVSKRLDDHFRLIFGKDLKCFLCYSGENERTVAAVVGLRIVPVKEWFFRELCLMYGRPTEGEIPCVYCDTPIHFE
ncbi:hypothetical protein ABVU25_005016 [Escherichia coli]